MVVINMMTKKWTDNRICIMSKTAQLNISSFYVSSNMKLVLNKNIVRIGGGLVDTGSTNFIICQLTILDIIY